MFASIYFFFVQRAKLKKLSSNDVQFIYAVLSRFTVLKTDNTFMALLPIHLTVTLIYIGQ